MENLDEKNSPFGDLNGLVAAILDDVADQPVPQAEKTRLSEIRHAAAIGTATNDMIVDIIRLFPDR